MKYKVNDGCIGCGLCESTYWDLGIGSNTPTVIKLPFMQMTYKNPEATYAAINLGEAFTVEQIKDRSIVIDGDIGEVLEELLN